MVIRHSGDPFSIVLQRMKGGNPEQKDRNDKQSKGIYDALREDYVFAGFRYLVCMASGHFG